MKKRLLAQAALAVALAVGASSVFAVPQQPVDDSVSQGTGIVRPSQAVGAIKADMGFTYFKDVGGIAVCAEQKWSVDCKKYVSPEEFIKGRFPKREYVGFQIFVLNDGPQLYLYYR
ncbi:hypothetical protein WJ97_14105 [Burkholderia ubonensis]|uniref:hypothetical protein n=1 Tax=Burkholderia ubonensis TaxID=101571 RepID=UPI000751F492|nr:hypothetical protein [Burkholderia ubonensis]KVP96950.1 hypothetical protein WJ97_14105 [Burkholderia ubonensis]